MVAQGEGLLCVLLCFSLPKQLSQASNELKGRQHRSNKECFDVGLMLNGDGQQDGVLLLSSLRYSPGLVSEPEV